MFKWIYKIFLVAINISFFISATELNIGKCHNTFFDEYDTYLSGDNATAHAVVKAEQIFPTDISCGGLPQYLSYHSQNDFPSSIFICHHSPQLNRKLFLYNSSLLI